MVAKRKVWAYLKNLEKEACSLAVRDLCGGVSSSSSLTVVSEA